MANRVWTKTEDDILREDRANRVAIPVTAAKLNRPIPATYLRARKLGTQVQTHVVWTSESEALLVELVRGDAPLTDKEMAARLDRSVESLRWKMQVLGLTNVRDRSKLQIRVMNAVTGAPKAAKANHPVARNPRQCPLKATKQKRPIDVARLLKADMRRIERAFAIALRARERKAAAMEIALKRDAIKLAETISKRIGLELKRRADAAVKTARDQQAKAARAEIRAAQEREASLRKHAATASATKPVTAPCRAPIVVMAKPAARPTSSAPEAAKPKDRRTFNRGFSRKGSFDRQAALDLSKAAQEAVARFIRERGVTRDHAEESYELVTRLQRRGYVVVPDEKAANWIVDGRHNIDSLTSLRKFAEDRGHA